MQILFDNKSIALNPKLIARCLRFYPKNNSRTVHKVIEKSRSHIDRSVFSENVALLLQNFVMTRTGPFRGIKYLQDGSIHDPENKIAACWDKIGDDLIKLKQMLKLQNCTKEGRILVEISPTVRDVIVSDLDKVFTKLLPVCAGRKTTGRVGASMVLFAVLPEIARAIDHVQWDKVFKITNYGDIISEMAVEIIEWENQTGEQLDSFDPYPGATLPFVYNVIALEARPKIFRKKNIYEGANETFNLKSEALANLLDCKGIITNQELAEEMTKVQASFPGNESKKDRTNEITGKEALDIAKSHIGSLFRIEITDKFNARWRLYGADKLANCWYITFNPSLRGLSTEADYLIAISKENGSILYSGLTGGG